MSDVLYDFIEKEDESNNINGHPVSLPPEEENQEKFPGRNNRGTSQIDLSIPENKQAMDDEYNEMWNLPTRIDGQLNQEKVERQNQCI